MYPDAEKKLLNSGFAPNLVYEYSRQLENIVLRQEPRAGVPGVKGESVTLIISQSEEKVSVPGVVGMNVELAEVLLKERGFVVKLEEVDDDRVKGEVISQYPAELEYLTRNSVIFLQVSSGKAFERYMPDLVGMRKIEAKNILRSMGVVASFDYGEAMDYNNNKIVISQTPEAGTSLSDIPRVYLKIGEKHGNSLSLVIVNEAGIDGQIELSIRQIGEDNFCYTHEEYCGWDEVKSWNVDLLQPGNYEVVVVGPEGKITRDCFYFDGDENEVWKISAF